MASHLRTGRGFSETPFADRRTCLSSLALATLARISSVVRKPRRYWDSLQVRALGSMPKSLRISFPWRASSSRMVLGSGSICHCGLHPPTIPSRQSQNTWSRVANSLLGGSNQASNVCRANRTKQRVKVHSSLSSNLCPGPRTLRQLVHLATGGDVGEPEFVREVGHKLFAARGQLRRNAFFCRPEP